MNITDFKNKIYEQYYSHGRTFPWRDAPNPYHVFISEVMLQQTQTSRVVPKFEQFIVAFPSFEALAAAPFPEVLLYWKGLGYNRRALSLQKSAQKIVTEFGGALPTCTKILESFPGIGPATAASIVAFAFNKPTVFIETNIRTVFIYEFFRGQALVKDSEILPLVEKTLDIQEPRMWYYALTDYGVMLKKELGSNNARSAHYVKQSKFIGSVRQIRGQILEFLLHTAQAQSCTIAKALQKDAVQIEALCMLLCKEGLVEQIGMFFSIAKQYHKDVAS